MAFKRMFTGVAIGIVCALGVNVARQGQDTQFALSPPRQNIDASIGLSEPATEDVTTPHFLDTTSFEPDATAGLTLNKNTSGDSPTPTPSRFFDEDIAYQEIEFGTQEIDTLLQQGAVPFELPGHAPVTLTLHDHQHQFGGDRISVQHGDTLSTITRRGDVLFATIALPTGSFRLESRGNVSRVYPHQTLAQRASLYEVDYRHVH